MKLLVAKIRAETGVHTFDLSIRKMDRDENRKFVRDIAERLFGQRIYLSSMRGGNHRSWVLYQGRTLMKHFKLFNSLHPDESALDALVPLDHLKGNRTGRISWDVKVLMKKAWEKEGFDLKGPAPANVMKLLKSLINQENIRRRRNETPDLLCPSQETLLKFREKLLSESEYLTAVKGEKFVRNKRGRGSTDIRALILGELVEIDECKASLILSAKRKGTWERLSESDKKVLKEIDKVIRDRLFILVLLDIATRMPLAWIVTDQPKAEATLALMRMATRDKTREKIVYNCENDPAPVVGIGHIKNDNGPGLRNSSCVSAYMGLSAMNTIVRTYSATDKPYIERMFGTTEAVLFKLIHGYTGRKAGELPGYDAQANGVLDIDELTAILTRFMIDEYPSMQHFGFGMGGRRPIEVLKQVQSQRKGFPVMDPSERRIHLGWKQQVTPNDEGARVFGGIWYNSDDLQKKLEEYPKARKIDVFVDPDDLSLATAIIPRAKDPITLEIQTTVFADMTLPEVLNLMEEVRKEHPTLTDIHEDLLARVRLQRHEKLRAIGVERNLPRSYSTVEECKAKAKSVFAGARVMRPQRPSCNAPVGRIMDVDADAPWVLPIGGDEPPSDCLAENKPDAGARSGARKVADPGSDSIPSTVSTGSRKKKVGGKSGSPTRYGRPEDVGSLE
ncbi:hypothetical protein [Phaeobacter italicus]|uniref:hypothetical protein n=1 Tax=Phaeobacter italicus TaxID=481446 RepID=UPI002432DA01|nr:hypothetical protein [Phaeobacter italicus]MCI5098716.1 hypothetical protein [Phaeobacter italicus]